MAAKIVLDAGHGGWDNGASFENRREKEDMAKETIGDTKKFKSQKKNFKISCSTESNKSC